ncbi:MAG: hypothetical protein IT378_21725 [Sandaracinaceae bacterium]|nr:hypothetical protein [Sandaracinaceae bacterium]
MTTMRVLFARLLRGALGGALLFFFFASSTQAQVGLRLFAVEGIRVDGALRDWQGGRFATLGEGDDASMEYLLGYDERGLYLAAQVRDDRLVRSAQGGTREDAIILTLAFPEGRGFRGHDLYFFPGEAGRVAAAAGIAPVGGRPSALRGAQVVEGPRTSGRGYVLEAFVPFAAIPSGREWRRARASIRLRDVDAEAHPEVESELALVPVEARGLERLVPLVPEGGAAGALEQFLRAQSLLAARPSRELTGDVAADGRPERVYLVDRFVVITGESYRDGGYSFHALAIDQPSDVRASELRDLTGDGKAELVLTLRQRNAQGERDVWQVLALSGDSPRPIFGIEIRKSTPAGFVEARVRVTPGRRGQPASIELASGRAQGLDASSYRESPASDVEPILVPWGPIAARTYRWDGRAFARAGERNNPRYTPPAPEPSAASAQPQAPAAPAPPSEDALLAAFRRERGIGANARPRFRFQADLAGGREPETALVYGRQLVAVGPGIQNGTSWLFYEVPVASDGDLLDASAADVTGDGKAELLFRVRQVLGDVTREVLVVHQLTDRGLPRLLAVEVARSRGASSVTNEVSTRGGSLAIAPGRARAWDASSWPFGAPSGSDGVEPLLLPWSDSPARYRLAAGRLQRR